MLAREAGEARFLGTARIPGRLFQVAEYPGLVLTSEPDRWVQGEIYVLDRPSDTLSRLDDYEGCGPNDPEPHEFERVVKDIVLDTGARGKAWVYVYTGSTADLQEIGSGDYRGETG